MRLIKPPVMLNNWLKAGLASENSTIAEESASKKPKPYNWNSNNIKDNYNAIAGNWRHKPRLWSTTSQALTAQMQNTTGLASIMNPRISQTAADLTAQLAVINGAVNILFKD